ncbi:hypothetical protein GCM10025857_34950 [Alicyclobacillus contaminans]|nr:hypothetical protein GCM10025857_34950 [Alicyclobacillus contaminans]
MVVVACAAQMWVYRRSPYVPLTGDMVYYNHAANLLLQKHVLTYWSTAPAAQVMPGYPLFVALCKWFAGHVYPRYGEYGLPGLRFTVLVQCVISVCTSLVLYRVARRLCRPLFAGIATLVWTLYLPQVVASTMVLTETLYILLFWCFVLAVWRAVERPTMWRWAVSGLLLGLSVLVRPTPLPVMAGLALYMVLQVRVGRWRWMDAIRHFGAALGALVLCLVPWWIRNLVTLHRLILTSDDAGNPLLFGSVPSWAHYPTPTSGFTAQQQEAQAIRNIEQGFHDHPLGYLKWYTIDKLWLMFSSPWYGESGALLWWVHLHGLWVCLGVIGLAWAAVRRVGARWFAVLLVVLVGLQLPFIPLPRYVLPVMPGIFVGVGLLLQQLSQVLAYKRALLD